MIIHLLRRCNIARNKLSSIWITFQYLTFYDDYFIWLPSGWSTCLFGWQKGKRHIIAMRFYIFPLAIVSLKTNRFLLFSPWDDYRWPTWPMCTVCNDERADRLLVQLMFDRAYVLVWLSLFDDKAVRYRFGLSMSECFGCVYNQSDKLVHNNKLISKSSFDF